MRIIFFLLTLLLTSIFYQFNATATLPTPNPLPTITPTPAAGSPTSVASNGILLSDIQAVSLFSYNETIIGGLQIVANYQFYNESAFNGSGGYSRSSVASPAGVNGLTINFISSTGNMSASNQMAIQNCLRSLQIAMMDITKQVYIGSQWATPAGTLTGTSLDVIAGSIICTLCNNGHCAADGSNSLPAYSQ
jgi:hypothetical protein